MVLLRPRPRPTPWTGRWIALIHQLHVAGEEGGSATMVAVFLPVLPVGVVYVAVGTKKLKEGPARGFGM